MPLVDDPFADPYFTASLEFADALRAAPEAGTAFGERWVHQISSPGSVVYVVHSKTVAEEGGRGLEAIKTLRAELTDHSRKRKAFETEAVWTRDIKSIFVLSLINITRHLDAPGGFLLRFPYCEGRTLRERMQHGVLQAAEITFHMYSVARGLHDLHTQGLVHKDLRPDNVLHCFGPFRAESRGYWRTLVADLGIATRVSAPAAGYFHGNYAYASPEQRAGAAAHPAMDIWAWGTLTLELLAQRPPTVTEDRFSWLGDLARRCLLVEPNDRPTAEQLVAGFGPYIRFGDEGFGVGAPPDRACAFYGLSPAALDLNKWSGWSAQLKQIEFDMSASLAFEEARLCYQIRTLPALRQAVHYCMSYLGVLSDPESKAQQLQASLADSDASSREDFTLAQSIGLQTLDVLCASLGELVDRYGLVEDIAALAEMVQFWEATGKVLEPDHLCRLMQAHLYLGNPERTAEIFNQHASSISNKVTLWATGRLLHRSLGNYAIASSNCVRLTNIAAEGAFSWLNNAIIDSLDGNDLDRANELAAAVPDFARDAMHLVLLLVDVRSGRALDTTRWAAIRSRVLGISADESYVAIRLSLEVAWAHGDHVLAQKRADSIRQDPVFRLRINRAHRQAVEAIAAGIDPGRRDARSCLEARAVLWERDGRPTELEFCGLDCVSADLWVRSVGAKASGYSPALASLVEASRANDGVDLEVYWRRRCHCVKCWETYRLENLGLCVRCGGLFCYQCRGYGGEDEENEVCRCGGDVVG